ncbi:hypothetical protein Tco_0986746, partial [Tanacetum coccineum]
DGDEVIVDNVDVVKTAKETRSVVEEVTAASTIPVNSAKPKADKVVIQEPEQGTTTTTLTTTTVATTIIAASTRPKAKGLVIHEQEQEPTPTISSKDKGKGIMVEEPLKMKKKDQRKDEANIALTKEWNDIQAKIEANYQLAQRLQAQEQEELTNEEKARFWWKRVPRRQAEIAHESSLKRAGEELEQESSKKQKLEEDKESEELKQCLEIIQDDGDDVTIDATPLSTKSPTIVDYKIYKEGKKSYFQIIRADVKARFKKTEPVNYMDNFLLLNLKTMFEHHVEDNVWKNQQGLVKVLNWKLYDSCGVHCVTMQSMLFYLLVEKMYPLTNHTLHQMFNDVNLQVNYECEMAFELLRLVKKQLKEGYVPE